MKKKNIFLIGDWCNENNNFFQDNKIKFLNSYNWNGLEKKTRGGVFTKKKYNYTLDFLTKKLNLIHSKDYDKKYWELLLGRWLLTFIDDTFAKWQIINQIQKKYKIDTVYQLNFKDRDFIPENSLQFHSVARAHNQYYSHWTFFKILKFQKSLKISTKEINLKKFFNLKKVLSGFNSDLYYFKVFNKSLRNRIFFYDLTFDKKFKLELMKNNYFINYLYDKKKINFKKIKNAENIRFVFFKNIKKTECNFQNFLNIHMKNCLPKVFLENYSHLDRVYRKLNWPKDPKFILTTYGQYYDEVFKIYCANKIIKNSKLFIFQHGYGGIFADNDFYGLNYDLNICDKFFTWGDNDKLGSFPFFYTKKHIYKNLKYEFSPKKKNIAYVICF